MENSGDNRGGKKSESESRGNRQSLRQRISPATLIVFFKASIVGLLFGEACIVARAIWFSFVVCVWHGPYQIWGNVLGVIGLISAVFYFYAFGFLAHVLLIVKSRRVDVVLIFMAGATAAVTLGGIGYNFLLSALTSISTLQYLVLLGIPPSIGFALLCQRVMSTKRKLHEYEDQFFLDDLELRSRESDLLGFSEKANRFAARVLNLGSSKSMVFGIDAPWGTGKSTFVNFCVESWSDGFDVKTIVYTFSPLQIQNESEIMVRFIDGLIKRIQKDCFIPELQPLFRKYTRFLKAKTGFSIFGIEIIPLERSVDDVMQELEHVLLDLDRKIIVVIDDLDRLHIDSVTDVLFAIKKAFSLPNISYVLCYDTQNICESPTNTATYEKLNEFLEKFVNVKVGLFTDASQLRQFVSAHMDKALSNNSQADPILVKHTMSPLIGILKSPESYRYMPFVGDVRKLKRVINTVLLLDIEKTDFMNADFDGSDLIHLLLIYINYPNIFRLIFDTETDDKRGFFSTVVPGDDWYPRAQENVNQLSQERSEFKNSTRYNELIKELDSKQPPAAFLLRKVFDLKSRLGGTFVDDVSDEKKHTYACFNGCWDKRRNLEQYLRLITEFAAPQKHTQYRFYANCVARIRQGLAIPEVLSEPEFGYDRTERNHAQFWRVIVNNPRVFDSRSSTQIIHYLLESFPNYSYLSHAGIGIGLRNDLAYFLVFLLDAIGWSDDAGQHVENTPDNIAEIAHWVFGKGSHAEKGVIKVLGDQRRGILGLYDLLKFRLYCCADRGGSTFNLQRALVLNSSSHGPTEGDVSEITKEEMRQISQTVFGVFQSSYIDAHRNVFELIDDLSVSDVVGKYVEFANQRVESGEIERIDVLLGALKSQIKLFTLFQLGSDFRNMGIGCGHYDPEGTEDHHAIRDLINDYLFDFCFNPEHGEQNYQHFLDYLLINLSSNDYTRSRGLGYFPSLSGFTKVMYEGRLREYWRRYGRDIKSRDFDTMDKIVYAGNYAASYQSVLEHVFGELDTLLTKHPDSGSV